MSYKITEAERKHVLTIEDMEIQLISGRSAVDNVPEYFITIEDPTETNEGIKSKLDSFKVALPKYDFLISKEDDEVGRINLINKNTSGLVISTDGFEHKGIGWRYELKAFNSKDGDVELVGDGTDYLYRLELIRENDNKKYVVDFTRLGDVVAKSLTVDGELVAKNPATFKSSMTLEENQTFSVNGTIDVNGQATFDGQASFNGTTTFTSEPTFNTGFSAIGSSTFQKDSSLGADVEQELLIEGLKVKLDTESELVAEKAHIISGKVNSLNVTDDFRATAAGFSMASIDNLEVDYFETSPEAEPSEIHKAKILKSLSIEEDASLTSKGSVVLNKAKIKFLDVKKDLDADGNPLPGEEDITYQANIESLNADNITAKNATFESITTNESANISLSKIKTDSITAVTTATAKADTGEEHAGTLMSVVNAEPSPDTPETDYLKNLPKGTVVIGGENTQLVFRSNTSIYNDYQAGHDGVSLKTQKIPIIMVDEYGNQTRDFLALDSDVKAMDGEDGINGVVKLRGNQIVSGEKTFKDKAFFNTGAFLTKGDVGAGTSDVNIASIINKNAKDEETDTLIQREYIKIGDEKYPLLLAGGGKVGDDVHISTTIHQEGVTNLPDNVVDDYKIPFVKDVIHKDIARETGNKIVGENTVKVTEGNDTTENSLELVSRRLPVKTGFSNLDRNASEDEWNGQVENRKPDPAVEETFVKFTSKAFEFKQADPNSNVVEIGFKGQNADSDGLLVLDTNSKSSGAFGDDLTDLDGFMLVRWNLPVEIPTEKFAKYVLDNSLAVHPGASISIKGLATDTSDNPVIGKNFKNQFEISLDVTDSPDFAIQTTDKNKEVLVLQNLVCDMFTEDDGNYPLNYENLKEKISNGVDRRMLMTVDATEVYVDGKIEEINNTFGNIAEVIPAAPVSVGTYNLIASVENSKVDYLWGHADIPAAGKFEDPSDRTIECTLDKYFAKAEGNKYDLDFYNRSFGLKLEVVPGEELRHALEAYNLKLTNGTSNSNAVIELLNKSADELKIMIDNLSSNVNNFVQKVVWTDIV